MPNWLLAVIQLLSVFVSGWLLYHTLRTWLEMRRPRISVTLEACRGSLLVLMIRNAGQSAACNVKALLDEPLFDFNGRDIRERYAFRTGFPVLPAGQGVGYPIDNVTAFFRKIDGDKPEEECAKAWRATVSYEWREARKRYRESMVVSPDYLRGGLVPTKTVEESLAEIVKHFQERGS